MGYVAASKKINTKAMVSMIVGIVSWVFEIIIFCFNATIGSLLTVATLGLGLLCLLPLFCFPPIGWIVAVLFGHLSMNEIKTTEEDGRGMAIAGLVLGYVGLGIVLVTIILSLLALLLGGSLAAIPVIGVFLEEILREIGIQ